jgi:hypothetical protein
MNALRPDSSPLCLRFDRLTGAALGRTGAHYTPVHFKPPLITTPSLLFAKCTPLFRRSHVLKTRQENNPPNREKTRQDKTRHPVLAAQSEPMHLARTPRPHTRSRTRRPAAREQARDTRPLLSYSALLSFPSLPPSLPPPLTPPWRSRSPRASARACPKSRARR